MAFGQVSGPPATRRQLDELLALVHRAGYDDLREARHPLGLTQRQAGGKFTRDEADVFIEQLQCDVDDVAPGGAGGQATSDEPRVTPPAPRRGPVTAAERSAAKQARAVRTMPSGLLAAELQRRGWAVMEP